VSGKVYLVGAGPGDPGLMTVRAHGLVRTADVLAYDELVPEAILALAPPGAEKLAVGRRHGDGPTRYKLHPLVLERALAGRSVVRLKAGDPMIFGRGGEEAETLAAAGVPFEIVPGVTAALGAASCTGIPLSHRDCASDVTFATGHGVDGSHVSHSDWDAIARTRGTLVLYMAAHKLAACSARLVAGGRAATTPAAYVEAASTPAQRVITGTLADLAERVGPVGGPAPGLVIIGEVVAKRVVADVASGAYAAPAATARGKGLVMVYTGQGKGKTTAALGLVWRALGRGLRVAVVQFIKGKWRTGERVFAETLPQLTFLVMGQGFTWESDDLSRDQRAAAAAWQRSRELILSGAQDLVVLDEITYAFSYGFVALDEVLATLRERPPHVHVVLTGRHAPEALVATADLVTEMKSHRHPFEKGEKAQPGVDF
jgi:cob(I)alamin adenosyltransferase